MVKNLMFQKRQFTYMYKETIYIYVFCKGELKKELREIKVFHEARIASS